MLAESIFDALSFHQVGIGIAIPIYGTNGFTPDHLDLLKRERVKRVDPRARQRRRRTESNGCIEGEAGGCGHLGACRRLSRPGSRTRTSSSCRGTGTRAEVFRQLLEASRRRHHRHPSPEPIPTTSPLREKSEPAANALQLTRDGVTYQARVHSLLLGRLRATVKATKGEAFHVDTIDLYASRSRSEYAKRAAKALGVPADGIESALLALVVEGEKAAETPASENEASPPAMSEAERCEALGFLRRSDLLDQAARDIDALGFVGEETNKRLLYLVAVSRKLEDPLSAIVLSQSGAGKSGLTEVIERLCPPEDVVLLTRLTPQSLYYTEPGFLDRKLVIVEERYGSIEADYSIRVLQSRKKLIAAAPVKDPQTGNMRTKVFTVEARAAFIEATTASSVNHENATRCFELMMDETEEQTRRIHERQRVMRTGRGLELRRLAEAITRRHWNAQRLLEPLPVVIPFADRLSFPSSWMRTRRDHARFLNLIEVSAFLHQHQRERTSGGRDRGVSRRLRGRVRPRRRGPEGNPLGPEEAAPGGAPAHPGPRREGRGRRLAARDPRGLERPGLDGAGLARRARGARVPGGRGLARRRRQGDALPGDGPRAAARRHDRAPEPRRSSPRSWAGKPANMRKPANSLRGFLVPQFQRDEPEPANLATETSKAVCRRGTRGSSGSSRTTRRCATASARSRSTWPTCAPSWRGPRRRA